MPNRPILITDFLFERAKILKNKAFCGHTDSHMFLKENSLIGDKATFLYQEIMVSWNKQSVVSRMNRI